MTTTKSLQRLPREGQIFGICAGLAAYAELDVALVRVIFVILAFITGGGFIVVYIILAFVIPTPAKLREKNIATETSDDFDFGDKVQDLSQELRNNKSVGRLRNYLGIGLLALGAWLLLEEFFPAWIGFRWDYVWPIVLIIVGILMISRRGK